MLIFRFEIGCLFPVLISFFVGTGQYGEKGPAWNSIVLFGGIALSRIGLFAFDLCQVSMTFLPAIPSMRCTRTHATAQGATTSARRSSPSKSPYCSSNLSTKLFRPYEILCNAYRIFAQGVQVDGGCELYRIDGGRNILCGLFAEREGAPDPFGMDEKGLLRCIILVFRRFLIRQGNSLRRY